MMRVFATLISGLIVAASSCVAAPKKPGTWLGHTNKYFTVQLPRAWSLATLPKLKGNEWVYTVADGEKKAVFDIMVIVGGGMELGIAPLEKYEHKKANGADVYSLIFDFDGIQGHALRIDSHDNFQVTAAVEYKGRDKSTIDRILNSIRHRRKKT